MAFNRASSSSSFSSSFTNQWAHDVFLSFRGEDTRNNFTAHLYAALCQNGINTYVDNDLERGENISPALLNAIKVSRISVIVLSQNYASSSWCLDELATILECKETKGQIVIPVFYNINPSEVRYQSKSFEETFAKHEQRFKDDQMKVQRWKTALTKVGNLSRYHLGNRNEHDFIKEIIDQMNSILVKETKFQVAQYLVGIESQVQAVKLLLDIEKKDSTCMVGIFGTGGIGKTTLAKAIFNSIASHFEGSCFLGDIRETSSQTGGLIRLQKELLSKILRDSSLMVDHVDQGVTLIEKRLRLKRILLVLDDVDQFVQLEKLARKCWFGLGSIIIITTRDEHLLRAHGVDSTYRVKELDDDEALQLFSWNVFHSDKPDGDYEAVTKDVVSYCGGLPLALTVLGSALKERDIDYWKSKLNEYKRILDQTIQKILKISYDGLEDTEKNIFLDIACFFNGQSLEECPLFPDHGIEVLVNKSLISISSYGRRLIMHDLLQDMGREIVRKESSEPGERSRLWFHEDIFHVLEEKTGTNKVEGILIDFPEPDLIHLSPKTFKKMKRLRLIIIRSAHFSEEPTFLPNELRLIDWLKYPGEYFPSNFHGKNLVLLRMPHSHLKELKALQGHPNFLRLANGFACIYPGNMIPNFFSYRQEASNTYTSEIDINVPQPLDLENKIFAFSAVIGIRTYDGEDEEDGEDGVRFQIHVKVINDGQKIYSDFSYPIKIARSDHVWLHYKGLDHSQLKTNNFRVEFRLRDIYNNPFKSAFFKSCGFQLEHRYEEKAIDSMDGIQHSKRRRDDDDDGNLESNWHTQKKRRNDDDNDGDGDDD